MKRIWMAMGILLLWASVSHAQNIITGEKAPELKTGEWLSKGNYTGSGKATVIEFFFSRSEPSMKRLSVLDAATATAWAWCCWPANPASRSARP